MRMHWISAASFAIAAAVTVAIAPPASAMAPGAVGQGAKPASGVAQVDYGYRHYHRPYWGWYAPWYRPYVYAPPPVVYPAPYYYAPYYYAPTYYYGP